MKCIVVQMRNAYADLYGRQPLQPQQTNHVTLSHYHTLLLLLYLLKIFLIKLKWYFIIFHVFILILEMKDIFYVTCCNVSRGQFCMCLYCLSRSACHTALFFNNSMSHLGITSPSSVVRPSVCTSHFSSHFLFCNNSSSTDATEMKFSYMNRAQ